MNNKQRLDFFLSRRDQPRMWWFERCAYLPQIYAALTDEEFDVLAEWFETTEVEDTKDFICPRPSTALRSAQDWGGGG